MVVAKRSFSIASSAVPASIRKTFAGGDDIKVVAFQQMPLWAACLGPVTGDNCIAFVKMLALRHRYEMLGVTASRILTTVMKHMLVRNRADEGLVDNAVDVLLSSFK